MNKQLLSAVLVTSLLGSLTALAAQSGMSHSGSFHALGAPTTGTATLSESGGKMTLTLSNLKTEPGPDLQVWLYTGAAPMKGAKDADIARVKHVGVGTLKKFSGNFTYTLPAGTKASDYKSVVLWCADVKTAFGAAPLQ
ncbi:hypothetical protein DAETH_38380 (plasmid) [Deinococcus aetherius]|uniref:DM13 domain-containing protein n=1 Tax=Deinococcus aetherius TaxID=200252 RepID=A0ABM8AJ85_9DEIO|nr:DM13 domain-containing protein [Deinococcus aetherius]BDP43869.1 hypothetical protein DAETH_38380 [Deinococcus aetherius]